MKPLLKEAGGYTMASGCALLVDMAILWALVYFLSWGYLVAATTSYLTGATVAYELSIRFAFKQHRLDDRRTELITFITIGTAGLAVNSAVIVTLVKYAGVYYLYAKVVAAGFTFLCNFIARRQLLFVQYSSAAPAIDHVRR